MLPHRRVGTRARRRREGRRGRLGYGTFTRRVSVRSRTVVVLLATAASTVLLGVLYFGPPAWC